MKREVFNNLIERRWGDAITLPKSSAWDDYEDWEEYNDRYEKSWDILDVEDIVDSTG